MEAKDFLLLLHPIIAIAFVFPLIGVTVNMAWQTRQRRLQNLTDTKSKIPPIVGLEHVRVGRILTGAIVGIELLAFAQVIFTKWLDHNLIPAQIFSFKILFVLLIFVATIASLVFLYKAREKVWRGIFASLTGMGLILLGFQEEIYRLDAQWYISHYYYGVVAAQLMIFALAILPDIYQDRSNFWRKLHVSLNCIALILFLGQAYTGSRDLLNWKSPPAWTEKYIQQLYEKQCQTTPCNVIPAPQPNAKP